jgi:hypothetical protein
VFGDEFIGVAMPKLNRLRGQGGSSGVSIHLLLVFGVLFDEPGLEASDGIVAKTHRGG